jgi:hypothetical protein
LGTRKKWAGEEKKMDCFPIENVPKTARGRAPKKKIPSFSKEKTRAQRAKKNRGVS